MRKARIAALQSQVEKLNDSVHFVEANRYYNGVQYNQYQLKKQQEAQRLQKQLDTEKKALGDAQESARKAGFGSAVYDPVKYDARSRLLERPSLAGQKLELRRSSAAPHSTFPAAPAENPQKACGL